MPKLTRAMLETGEVRFLLTIDLGGLLFRWASNPCDPVDDDEEPVPHPGALPPFEFTRTFSLLSREPDTRQVSMDLDFGVDVAELVQRGYDLSAATGELSVWVEGISYDARETLLRGVLVEPTYGEEGEPVSFTLRMDPWEDLGVVPEPAMQVNATTWPSRYEEHDGRPYPIPFGKVAFIDELTFADAEREPTPSFPSAIVEYNTGTGLAEKLLISGYQIEVDSNSVATIYDENGENSDTAGVTLEDDGNGHPCAVIDLTVTSALLTVSKSFWVKQRGGSQLWGGILKSNGTDAIEGAGDLLIWLLRRAQIEVDTRAFTSIAPRLNTYKVAGYIDVAVQPMQWIIDNLLPILPISLVSGPHGIKPILWEMDATVDDALEAIVAGAGATRTSPVSYVRGPADVVNEVQLSFALNPRDRSYQGTMVMGATYDADPTFGFSLAHARVSNARYGRRVGLVSTDIVYESPTAAAVASWMVRAQALPQRQVSYQGGAVYGHLEPGDVVTLTDAAMSFNAQVCLVSATTWASESTVELTLLIVDEPFRDR